MEQPENTNNINNALPQTSETDALRRHAIKTMAIAGAKIAAVTLPFALTAFPEKAQAQVTTMAAINALRFALRLEYFMGAYYRRGLSALTIPASERGQFTTMIGNLNNHAVFLDKTLVRDTVVKPADNSYDFTGAGMFSAVMQDYQIFLAVAQVLEDTAVRAYKGLMLSFAGQQIYMTAGMSLHSVRARHAAAVRYIRSTVYGANVKPWVGGSGAVFNDSGLPEADAFYQGENNTNQADVSVTGSTSVVVEAFDEPLTLAEAEALLARFKI